jgi:CheY-like chemotaxis protein
MEHQKILIVDDDPFIQSGLVEKFKEAGFDVLTAKDGEAGITYLADAPDIIITELLLPKVSGLEVLRRARTKSAETPLIVFSTVYRDEAFFEDLKNRYGISGYFIKPVQFEKVYSLIKDLKKQPQKQEKTEESFGIKKSSGEIVPFLFPVLLHKLYMSKATGRLRLQSGNIIKEFQFKNGRPVFAKSNLIQETLGRVLLDTGLISKIDYEMSIRQMLKEKKRHGEVLLEMGVLPINLKEALKIQLRQKLLNTFSWTSGNYYFVPEKELKIDIESEITPAEILLEGIKTQVDEKTCDSYLMEFLNYPVTEGKPNYSLKELKLSKEEEKLFLRIDGKKTLKELIDSSSMDKGFTKKLLIALLILGVIEVKNEEKVIDRTQKIDTIPKGAEDKGLKNEEDIKLHNDLNSYLNELKTKNYFEVLGLKDKVTDEDVKKSYFLMAREYHPDRFYNKDKSIKDTAEEIFTILTNAYNSLLTEDLRKKYVESLKGKKQEKTDGDVQSLVSAEIQFQKGMVYYKSQDYINAEECFKWAVKLNPNEAEYNGWLGWVLYKKQPGDSDVRKKAENAINHALQMNPKWDQGYLFLAYLARVEKNEEKAEKYFQKAIECNPNNQDAIREIRLINMRKEKSKGLFNRIFKK